MEKKYNLSEKSQGFVLGIIGKPGSGKTYIIKRLLENELKGKFSYVLLCSPSFMEYDSLIPASQKRASLDLEWLCKAINLINVSQQTSSVKNVLVILDDCVAEIKDKQKNVKLTSFIFNRRHLLWDGVISLIITSQKYTMVPARYRSCFTNLYLFSLSPFDMQKIFDESIIRFSKMEWQAFITRIFEKEFNFLEIDIDKQIVK